MTHRLLLGVNFGRWIFWGIIEGPKDFSFRFFPQFNHPRHLESGVTPRPYSPGCNVGTIYIPIHQVYVPQLLRTPLTG